MDKWEYDKEGLGNDDIPLRLNARGEAGWELVSLAPCEMTRKAWGWAWDQTTTRYLAVYKRRRP